MSDEVNPIFRASAEKKKTVAMDFTNPISSFCLAFTADCKSSLLYINGTK